jgi:DHA1 family bicyclomycin/chloramphenicol resistance-like MFS transporter
VVLVGLVVFTLASAGCALSTTIEQLVLFRTLQGMCAGSGMVVSRAIIRDLFPPSDAQRVMSQVTIFFGVAPAIAPLIGGWLYVHSDWHWIFWFLTAVGLLLTLLNWRALPESLPQAQPFALKPLMQGYFSMLRSRRFWLLVLASGIPFNSMFMYVLAAPQFLGQHLGLAPTQFFWFFCCSIGGIMGGAAWSGRVAGRMKPAGQIRRGFLLMVLALLANVALMFLAPQHAIWSLPLIGLFSLGWAFMVPVVTIMVLDLYPERRGMASSLQSAIASAANAVVAGALVPLVMHSLAGAGADVGGLPGHRPAGLGARAAQPAGHRHNCGLNPCQFKPRRAAPKMAPCVPPCALPCPPPCDPWPCSFWPRWPWDLHPVGPTSRLPRPAGCASAWPRSWPSRTAP